MQNVLGLVPGKCSIDLNVILLKIGRSSVSSSIGVGTVIEGWGTGCFRQIRYVSSGTRF